MHVYVCVVWIVALLTNTPNHKASSSPDEAFDPFATSNITDPKERQMAAVSRPLPALRSVGSTRAHRGATNSLPTVNHRPTKTTDTKEPKTDAATGTDVVRPPETIPGPKTSTVTTQDITPSFIPLMSTTMTPGSSIPSSTSLGEEHQNSSQSTTSETILPVALIPPSTLKDLITGSASMVEQMEQDGSSEPDVGDEDSNKVPTPSPLDPLFAGLISFFIISTALLSILLFLKFHQQSSHSEFTRLQDLPMDDLLEDTPLSRY